MRSRFPALVLGVALCVGGCNSPSDSPAPGPKAAGPAAPQAAAAASQSNPTGPNGSKIEFLGTKPGGQHVGGFSNFTVAIDPIKDDLSGSKITVDIDVDSIWTDTPPKLTAHLKSPDFFDV